MKIVLILLLTTVFCDCKSSKNARIIGGKPAYAGQYPFAAALHVTTSNGLFFCSGSLIAPEWILTAAQCINEAVSVTINLGSNTLEGEDANRVVLASSEHFVHPDFDPSTLQNDIGLVKLRMAVTYTDYVKRIYLSLNDLSDSALLVGIGWGHTSDAESTLSNKLQYVNLVSVSNDECKKIYAEQISDQMVCVAGDYNEGTCIGDSGSALLQFDYLSKVVRHVGISSFNSAFNSAIWLYQNSQL